jgi:hypothetical protein
MTGAGTCSIRYGGVAGTLIWSCPASVDSLSSSFLDLVSINLTPTARSAAGQAAEALGGCFLQSIKIRTAYKVPGTEISIDP